MFMNASKYLFVFFSFIFIGCSLERENVDSLGDVKNIYLVKEERLYDNNNGLINSNSLIDNVLDLSRCKRENRSTCDYVVIGFSERSKIIYRSNCLFCDAETYDESHYDNVIKLIDVNKKDQKVELLVDRSENNYKNKFELSLIRIDSEADRELLINAFK
ncbi:hypothetical protein [Fluviispira sanaruensis]|uniref:Lipoprotein n=1 Tax=Fluviispira sanaruensis TaxID=2493639 RepID=A0A4P2VIY5_FLUSA|nr:hypothetical protein [Fluviispira sanaruensis]BBH52418.1 hypothetical protein JCM31447_08590 [Fluviispira sanaruensis]